ncbi:FEZ2 family protein [Megaselia abdita]
MRDLGERMAELKFEAPLAKFEEADEWGGCEFISSTVSSGGGGGGDLRALNDNLNLNVNKDAKNFLEEALHEVTNSTGGATALDLASPNCNSIQNPQPMENFMETFGGSLEDLVNTFDEKISKCFGNYEQNLDDLAPVKIRKQEEIMSECQMWWTITGNFGNILPIDWSKSHARRLQLSSLDLVEAKNHINSSKIDDLSSEDEAVAQDLDMHALILNGPNTELDEPIKSAEEVIKEIDDIMDESDETEDDQENDVVRKAREFLRAPLYEGKLEDYSMSKLNEIYMDMEMLIKELSESLINELALRDELEYEKELKNSFICLLLAVQHKRRQYHVEKKKSKTTKKNELEPKYLTTVIPYNLEDGPPDNPTLQVLIKSKYNKKI